MPHRLVPLERLARPLRLGLLLALAGLAAEAGAAPAPWFLWRSRLNGDDHCAQASPGAGWDRLGGPFLDADCRRPLRTVTLRPEPAR